MNFSTLDLLVVATLVVHLHFEYRLWFRPKEDVFGKYRTEGMAPERAAKRAYHAKAVWLVLLILLQYGGLGFREALVYSFTAYALLILMAFPRKLYSLLHLLLAIACLAQLWLG